MVSHTWFESNASQIAKKRLEWITSAAQTGSITITKLDTVAGIVSGTFQFNAENDIDATKTITVTEGRFDIKL